MQRAVLLGVLLLFSGCSTPPDDVTLESDACLVEAADDYACADEDARNPSARPHLHDYWGGQDRLELEPVTVQASPFLCTSSASAAVIRPSDGETIIQGTALIEVTLSWDAWENTDLAASTELWVKTAADAEPMEVGPLDSGAMTSLAVTNEQNDLPHQKLSAWEFHWVLRPANPTGCFRYSGEVTMQVVLHRGHDIPLYPGHPDRWQAQQEMVILEEQREVFYYLGDTGGMCLSGPSGGDCLWEPHLPADGAVIPNDAIVAVTVVHEGASPLRAKLGVHGADTREISWLPPDTDDGTTRSYEIVAAGRGDGPYALQSQWAFWLVPEDASEFYNGAYQVRVVAGKG
jgi:hypothetical protein